MTQDELIHRLNRAREELTRAIAGLGETELNSVPVMGEWTTKDILAHIAAWEAETVTALARLRMGARPRYLDLTPEATDRLNDEWYSENKDRALERVQADFAGTRAQTLRRIQEFRAEDLSSPGKFNWLPGRTLADWILSQTAEHDLEHAGDIQLWRGSSGK